MSYIYDICWRRLLRVPWTARRSNQSVLKEINPEYSLEGLMLKLKLQYFPPDGKSRFIEKDPDAGKDWRQEEKGTTEDEIVGWHHWPDGHEFEQVPGDGEGQWSLVCCSPWVHKQQDMIEGLNNSNKRKSKIKVHQSVMSVLFFMLCLCVFLLIFCPEGNWFYFLTTSTITLARKPSTYP